MPSALVGRALIALVYPLARSPRLSPRWAFAALVLAASDTIMIAGSRIGVLDPFVALWSAVCICCALRYVQSDKATRWLVLCGLGGLALASKWSGSLALGAAMVIVFSLFTGSTPATARITKTSSAVETPQRKSPTRNRRARITLPPVLCTHDGHPLRLYVLDEGEGEGEGDSCPCGEGPGEAVSWTGS
jgi:hypothetical protein